VERDADRLGDYQDHQVCDHRGLHQGDHQDRHQDADHQDRDANRHQGVDRQHHQDADHQDRDANRQDLDVIREDQDANPQEPYVDPDASQHLDAVVGSNEDHQAAAGLPDPWTMWAAVAAELGALQETTGGQEPVALVGDLRVGAHRAGGRQVGGRQADAAQVDVPPVGVLEQPGWAATK
jgi:hypothetical protein